MRRCLHRKHSPSEVDRRILSPAGGGFRTVSFRPVAARRVEQRAKAVSPQRSTNVVPERSTNTLSASAAASTASSSKRTFEMSISPLTRSAKPSSLGETRISSATGQVVMWQCFPAIVAYWHDPSHSQVTTSGRARSNRESDGALPQATPSRTHSPRHRRNCHRGADRRTAADTRRSVPQALSLRMTWTETPPCSSPRWDHSRWTPTTGSSASPSGPTRSTWTRRHPWRTHPGRSVRYQKRWSRTSSVGLEHSSCGPFSAAPQAPAALVLLREWSGRSSPSSFGWMRWSIRETSSTGETDLEERFTSIIGDPQIPYVYVRGNHDSAANAKAIAAQPNTVVLHRSRSRACGYGGYGTHGSPQTRARGARRSHRAPDGDQTSNTGTPRGAGVAVICYRPVAQAGAGSRSIGVRAVDARNARRGPSSEVETTEEEP